MCSRVGTVFQGQVVNKSAILEMIMRHGMNLQIHGFVSICIVAAAYAYMCVL